MHWSETVQQFRVSATEFVLKAGVYNPYTMSGNIIVDGDETSQHSIDHYLGKEVVLNLTALRFGNQLFKAVWTRATSPACESHSRRIWVLAVVAAISTSLSLSATSCRTTCKCNLRVQKMLELLEQCIENGQAKTYAMIEAGCASCG